MYQQNQLDLITEIPLQKESNFESKLLHIVEDFETQRLLKPSFQREFVWTKQKVQGWALSIENDKAIGVMVTYQLYEIKDSRKVATSHAYLADGFQRLQATRKLLDDPLAYGWNVSKKEARERIRNFSMTVQHRHYESDSEALAAFQALNSGTQVTPYEYYKGDLTLHPVAVVIQERVPGVLTKYEEEIFPSGERQRERIQKRARDAYALFHRFVTGDTRSKYDNIGSTVVNPNKAYKQIEPLLVKYIDTNDKSLSDINREIDQFERQIDNWRAEMRVIFPEVPQKTMSPTLWRYLAHLYIYCITKNIKHEKYIRFVHLVKDSLADYRSFQSRFDVEDQKGEKITITLQLGGIHAHNMLERAFNFKLEPRERRRKNMKTAPGWHESHKLPFAKYGNGETFAEPARRNLARGAKPLVFDEEE